MKFGRQGILILVILGLLAVIMAILGPLAINGVSVMAGSHEKSKSQWQLAAKGVVESKSDVELSSQVTGSVKKVLVDEGDYVKSEQPVVLFDDAKMIANVEIAEATVRQAEARLAELERGYRAEDIEASQRSFESKNAVFQDARTELAHMERLLKSGAVTKEARDRAKRDYDVAEAELHETRANWNKMEKGPRKEEIMLARADLDRAKAELKYSRAVLLDYTILSPIDGLVTDRFANTGETVDIGTPVFTVIDPNNLRIWAELEESDAGKITQGQAVEIVADALPEKKFKGKVVQVFNAVQRKRQKTFDPVASFDINTQKIHIELEDYSGLVHGLTVTVLFSK